MENLGPFQFPLSFYGTAAVVLLAALLFAAWRNCCKEAAGWIALLIAGQACALQLVWAGAQIRLQMFRGWGELLGGPRAIFFAALLLQTVLVLWGMRRYWPAVRAHARHIVTWPQAVLVLLLLIFSATTIAPEWAQALAAGDWRGVATRTASHGTKVALGLLIAFAGLLNLILAAASLPANKWERVVAWWSGRERRWLPWGAALWVVLVSSLLAWTVLERIPHIPDEVAYLFEARHLAQGRLAVAPPPDAEAFFIPFTYPDSQRWLNAMPIGWPAILAVGVWLGVPWLVNPLLGGLAVLLTHALARRMYGRALADGAALLLAASPWLLFLSASLMAHAASLVLFLLAMLGVSHARDRGHIGWAAVAGLACGALLHVRPLEAVVAAAVGGGWWLAGGWKNLRWLALGATTVSGTALGALLLAYNRYVTGDPFYVPLNGLFDRMYYAGSNRLGFGADIGKWGWTGLDALPGHGVLDVLMNSNQNLHMVNFELFGWICGSLLLVFCLAAWGSWRRDAVAGAWLLATIAAMSLYWFSGGPDFGARYWYPVIIPCVLLTLRGAQILAGRLQHAGAPPGTGTRVWAMLALATAIGTVNLLAWRSTDKYYHYRGTRPDLRALHDLFGRSLVLIRGPQWPDYASASPLNPPSVELSEPGTIYARDLGPESNERLRRYYADRPVWLVLGPSVTGGGFRILGGPIPPGQPLEEKGQP